MKVRIQSVIRIDGSSDTVTVEHMGIRRRDGSAEVVEYAQADSLRVEDDCVTIREAGEMRAVICLRADGVWRMTAFSTPYGDLHLEILTEELRIMQTEQTIGISTRYRSLLDGKPFNEVRMRITVRKKE